MVSARLQEEFDLSLNLEGTEDSRKQEAPTNTNSLRGCTPLSISWQFD
jgi:hypothetical protein